MKKYTEAIHAEGLLKIFDREKPCRYCPAPAMHIKYEINFEDFPCNICWDFIGMSPHIGCPCIVLGKHEAAKRTWLALEEKGYI